MPGDSGFHWDVLLTSIEEGRVVPVIGPELLVLDRGGETVRLDALLAERLLERIGAAAGERGSEHDLKRVASQLLERDGHRGVLYSTLHTILSEERIETPRPLLELARLEPLRLFVTTTFDGLMARALDEVRFGGQRRTRSLAYSLRKRVEDLPCEVELLEAPVVFHVFGRSSTAADYVVTEEDLLEFVHVLQGGDRRPKLLFDALRDHNLLVLGCSFPDWLTRFFVRVLSDIRLLDARDTLETVADDRTAHDLALASFLRQCRISVYQEGGTTKFVEELSRRWQERHPPRTAAAQEEEAVAVQEEMPAGGIFLSYANEDREAVLELKRGLEGAGLEVWFDQRRLEAGDVYERKIRHNIETCSFFFPVISDAACRRLEGYYRKEWFWAIERSRRFDRSFPFIQPIVVDDTAYTATGIPEEFSDRHWQRFPGGVPTPEFLELTRERVRELRKRAAGRL